MYLEEYKVGQTWEVGGIEITAEQIKSFAAVYDPVPLHLDEEYAAGTRFGGLISSGFMSFLLIWAKFQRCYGAIDSQLVAGISNHMAWMLPAYAGDTLRGVVRVVSIEPRNNYNGILEVVVDGYNQDDVHILRGGGKAVIKRRDPS